MATLRTRLIAAVVMATLVPVAAAVWIGSMLVERSLAYSANTDLERLSRTLEDTGRRFYQLERDTLRRDADAGRVAPTRYSTLTTATWPEPVSSFAASGEAERFLVAGSGGDHLELLRRSPAGIDTYQRDLGGIRMEALSAELARTREVLGASRSRDLRRGLTLTLVLMVSLVSLASLVPLVYVAHRVSLPIQQLTAGLSDLAAGDWDCRVADEGDDEVGRAVRAFNQMAGQLQRNQSRLVYLTQMTSWQLLARKTAHELKNSLTPIRLTIEELVARQPIHDREFIEQAAQIVVSEIETLERRVRAFSEFAGEPPVATTLVDVNALVTERTSFLAAAHPDTTYDVRLESAGLRALADADLLKGALTNLLENGAEAAGPSGVVRILTRLSPDVVVIEVHDSGPGLNPEAEATLFEPTITFKKGGMGLGLSIARKNALLCGGDITLIPGQLGGAGFRVSVPIASGVTPTT
jgi:two-component system, NtrC family, nitrogen regulation sensor histidine kinase NtrY